MCVCDAWPTHPCPPASPPMRRPPFPTRGFAASPRPQPGSPPASRLAARAAATLDPALLAKARRLALPVGVAAGAFGSVVGVGGGTLIVPVILAVCTTLPQRLAAGSSLAAVVATATAAAPAYVSAGAVDGGAAAAVCAGALVATRAGTRAAGVVSPRTLRGALGGFVLTAATVVPVKAWWLHQRASEAPPVSSDPPASPHLRYAGLAVIGGAAGFASGLLGVGGGVLVTPALALAGVTATHAAAVGTSLAAMAPPAALALASHAAAGNVDARLAAGLAAGALAGSAVGSRIAVGAPPGVMEGAFGLGMGVLGIRTLRTALRMKK